MQDILKVKDIMTSGWIATLNPHDSLIHAAKLFGQYNYDGFPVVNEDGKLLGLVTAYDMVTQSYAIHLPPLINILAYAYKNQANEQKLKDQFAIVKTIKVRDMMNEDPLIVGPEVRVEDLAKEFIQHHRVNPIPVLDLDKKLLGVVSRFDIIRFFDEKYFHKMLVESGHGGVLQRLGRI